MYVNSALSRTRARSIKKFSLLAALARRRRLAVRYREGGHACPESRARFHTPRIGCRLKHRIYLRQAFADFLSETLAQASNTKLTINKRFRCNIALLRLKTAQWTPSLKQLDVSQFHKYSVSAVLLPLYCFSRIYHVPSETLSFRGNVPF